MTTNIKELVKRLRKRAVLVNYGNGTFDVVPNKDCNDAADALESLAGVVERYKAMLKDFTATFTARGTDLIDTSSAMNQMEKRAEAAIAAQGGTET